MIEHGRKNCVIFGINEKNKCREGKNMVVITWDSEGEEKYGRNKIKFILLGDGCSNLELPIEQHSYLSLG